MHPVTNTPMRQEGRPSSTPTTCSRWKPRSNSVTDLATRSSCSQWGRHRLRTPCARRTFGADRPVLLTDHFFAGADTLATTYAFATAIRKIGDWFSTPDIIFTGKQIIDGHTAQVGPDMARRLGLLQLTYVAKIAGLELTSRPVDAEPRAEGGVQGVHTNLPCLITRLELTNQICGGLDGRPPCAARAPVVKSSAQQAGFEDVSNGACAAHRPSSSGSLRLAARRQGGASGSCQGAGGAADRTHLRAQTEIRSLSCGAGALIVRSLSHE